MSPTICAHEPCSEPLPPRPPGRPGRPRKFCQDSCRAAALLAERRAKGYATPDPERTRQVKAAYYQATKDRAAERQRANGAARRATEAARKQALRERATGTVTRAELFRRHDGVCHWCLEPIEGTWQMDHIIPVSKGGPHCYDNVAPIHPKCNQIKHDKIASGRPELLELAVQAWRNFWAPEGTDRSAGTSIL